DHSPRLPIPGDCQYYSACKSWQVTMESQYLRVFGHACLASLIACSEAQLRLRISSKDAWLRWQGTDRSMVQDPPAFLATATTRLAITFAQYQARKFVVFFIKDKGAPVLVPAPE